MKIVINWKNGLTVKVRELDIDYQMKTVMILFFGEDKRKSYPIDKFQESVISVRVY